MKEGDHIKDENIVGTQVRSATISFQHDLSSSKSFQGTAKSKEEKSWLRTGPELATYWTVAHSSTTELPPPLP